MNIVQMLLQKQVELLRLFGRAIILSSKSLRYGFKLIGCIPIASLSLILCMLSAAYILQIFIFLGVQFSEPLYGLLLFTLVYLEVAFGPRPIEFLIANDRKAAITSAIATGPLIVLRATGLVASSTANFRLEHNLVTQIGIAFISSLVLTLCSFLLHRSALCYARNLLQEANRA